MHETTGDGELLARYRNGDIRAFDILYSRFRVPLFNFLLRQSGRRHQEVEEVFQETWLKVVRSVQQYDPSQPFAPWLYRIARNCLVDRWRYLSSVETLHVSNDIAMSGASSNGLFHPERRAASEEIHARWKRALAELPALQREVVLLKMENDFSLDELAIITHTGRETVKSRLRYGVAKLRELLEGVVDEYA